MYAAGLGKITNNRECRADSLCSAVQNAYCYTAGYFTGTCGAWRAGIDGPIAVPAPEIDTRAGSPTYGQATVNGRVVETPADVDEMLAEQIAEQHRLQQAATAGDFGRIADSPSWSGYIGGAIPAGLDFKMPDLLPVVLVVAAVAALSIAKG